MQPEYLEIDGSHGEGGGSIVRAALSVSALTGKPVRIYNVRGGLRKPGANVVDLALLRILGSCTEAHIQCRYGDTDIFFAPKRQLRPFRDRFDLSNLAKGSAPGSVPLILQTVLVPLSRAGRISTVTLKGGTHVPYSPTYEYFENVALKAFEELGVYAWPSLTAAGYSPAGGGEVSLEIEPSQLNGFDFREPGALKSIHAWIVTSELPEHVRKRGVERLERLAHRDGLDIKIRALKPHASSPGAAVTIGAYMDAGYGGGQSLGHRGKPMEQVVEEAYEDFLEYLDSGCGVDRYLADHLVLPACLCHEPAVFTTARITSTLLTVAWVVKQFMPVRLTVHGKENESGEIRVEV
ncbi:MAG: RNA 3'-phosphate cyclase [Armatimonadetes bacterium]|nr:MAG: RNA 3'-phosphate cyclase [Armatimonadota bacterium]